MKRLIVVLAVLSVLAGCTRHVVVTPTPGSDEPEWSAPASEELDDDTQEPSGTEAEQETSPSVGMTGLTVIRDKTYDLQLGPFVYTEYNWVLRPGDHFTGEVLARRDTTVQIWLEDPNGVNWAPKECVAKWEWDTIVPEGRDGEWMIRFENTKWFGIIDVNVHMTLNVD